MHALSSAKHAFRFLMHICTPVAVAPRERRLLHGPAVTCHLSHAQGLKAVCAAVPTLRALYCNVHGSLFPSLSGRPQLLRRVPRTLPPLVPASPHPPSTSLPITLPYSTSNIANVSKCSDPHSAPLMLITRYLGLLGTLAPTSTRSEPGLLRTRVDVPPTEPIPRAHARCAPIVIDHTVCRLSIRFY
ncbi:hypothetical protein HYPSUDRAFT_203876 [Hypholoma sublateritium FD-334 SS-4]|uniref:Uncharacterized protein n=1 Tax=Hypholoma sublateritium (strain FD-334 SS-4) TaxID=945553 RepID=A0A0D2PK85_HYPSF|nr:hypothetical protein HYPSUDRAFT_203876 [Hypholoma sublateritium FD-334 SS-4]